MKMRLRPVLRGQSTVALWHHICHMSSASRFDISAAWESKQLQWNEGFSINTFTTQAPHPELFWQRVSANISQWQTQAVCQSAPRCQKPFPACIFLTFSEICEGQFLSKRWQSIHPPPQCREQQQADNLNVFYSLAQTETSHNQMRVLQNEAGEHHIQHLDNQRWSSTGMWALPTALLPLHHLCASGDLPVKTIGFIPNNDESIQTGGLSWFLVQLEQPRAVWI